MDNSLKAAAQKELLRRKAKAELDRRKATQQQGDKVAPYGLTGLITGQKAPQPEQPPIMEDMAKGAGTGVAQGVISGLGAFGDAADTGEKWTHDLAGYAGAPEWLQSALAKGSRLAMGPFGNMPGTEKITQAVEAHTGPMYEAQTTPGKFAQTVGQFAPSAALGPGTVARKAAMAVVPGVASEAAGQLTEGTEVEPYARVAGALAGGVAAAGRGGAAIKQATKNAPSLEQVSAQTNTAYDRLRNAGIQFDDSAYKSFALKTVDKLRKHGWRPRDGDPISGDIKEIVDRIGKPNNWDEIENLRQFVGNLPKTASNKDFARAAIIREGIDDLIDSGKLVSTKGLDPSIVGTMAKQARELGRKNIIAKKLTEMQDKSQWYLGGEESGLRNQVASFGKQQKNLTPAEEAAFRKVVRREGVLNALNLTGSRIGQAVMAAGGFAGGGLPGAAITTAAHFAARKGSEAYTKKALKDAMAVVLAGRPAQKAALSKDKLTAEEIIIRRLLAVGAGQQSIPSH
jgi:hypothetical protein